MAKGCFTRRLLAPMTGPNGSERWSSRLPAAIRTGRCQLMHDMAPLHLCCTPSYASTWREAIEASPLAWMNLAAGGPLRG